MLENGETHIQIWFSPNPQKVAEHFPGWWNNIDISHACQKKISSNVTPLFPKNNLKKRKKFHHQHMNAECHFKYFFLSGVLVFFGPNYLLLGLNDPWMLWLLRRYLKLSVSLWCHTVRSVEIQFFCQHGDHAGNLLLLAEAGVFGPGLEAGGHHVVDPGQDLHYLQLLAELVEDGAERLDEPGAAPWVPPWVIPWHSGVGKEEICLHRDLMSGISISLQGIVGRTRICLYTVVKFRTPASLDEEEFWPSD